jgi:ABC-type dipeptide/oligopeptide/nickel transport system ATPase component
MAKVLILGESGSGKSTSIGKSTKLGIKGLNPIETFIIACTNKDLPFKGWRTIYTRAKIRKNEQGIIIDLAPEGNYYYTNIGANVANLILLITEKRPEIKNIIIDDTNYLLQDYYMANAMKGGYDVFKKIGAFMNKIFAAIQVCPIDKNIIVLAHYEEFKSRNGDVISFRFKTVGKMVNFAPSFI